MRNSDRMEALCKPLKIQDYNTKINNCSNTMLTAVGSNMILGWIYAHVPLVFYLISFWTMPDTES